MLLLVFYRRVNDYFNRIANACMGIYSDGTLPYNRIEFYYTKLLLQKGIEDDDYVSTYYQERYRHNLMAF